MFAVICGGGRKQGNRLVSGYPALAVAVLVGRFPTDFRTVLFLLHLVIFLAGILAFSPHTYTGFDDAFGQNHGGSDYHCHSGLAALFWIGGDYILRKPVVPPESKMESDESA